MNVSRKSLTDFGRISKDTQGSVLELRGDALIAEFECAFDAVSATLSLQQDQDESLANLEDDLKPVVRTGIALAEVIIADNTVTGAGVVLAMNGLSVLHDHTLYVATVVFLR